MCPNNAGTEVELGKLQGIIGTTDLEGGGGMFWVCTTAGISARGSGGAAIHRCVRCSHRELIDSDQELPYRNSMELGPNFNARHLVTE